MNNKITYHREGDYFIPDLCLPKQPDGHIGKYGRLRLNYLKNFAKAENVNELLKEHHQMEWVQAMNNIKNRAEEIILNKIIYV